MASCLFIHRPSNTTPAVGVVSTIHGPRHVRHHAALALSSCTKYRIALKASRDQNAAGTTWLPLRVTVSPNSRKISCSGELQKHHIARFVNRNSHHFALGLRKRFHVSSFLNVADWERACQGLKYGAVSDAGFSLFPKLPTISCFRRYLMLHGARSVLVYARTRGAKESSRCRHSQSLHLFCVTGKKRHDVLPRLY